MNKRFLLTIFGLILTFLSMAQYKVQSKYFVYLQTEPSQPFYVKINNQQISANSSGYLILPQLNEGEYRLTVGFPQNKYPEQVYKFRIDSKDKGYLIKNFGDDGWGLFDLQTMAVQKPMTSEELIAINTPKPTPKVEEPKKEVVPAENVSDFTKVLSKAANDPSLLEKPKPEPVEEKPVIVEEKIVKVEPAKIDTPVIVKASETTVQVVEEKKAEVIPQKVEEVAQVAVAEAKPATPIVIEEKMQTGIKKLSESVTTEGVTLVYEDKTANGSQEPITIFIPNPPAPQEPIAVPQVPQVAEQKEIVKTEETPEEVKKEQIQDEPKKMIKSNNCVSVAEENDFLKLRRNMASKDNDDEMISEAKRSFKSKCYSTAQIKYLSSMFLSNAGKYNFYEAAYPFVSDPENFEILASEIKDENYKAKFNGLLNR